MKNIIEFIKKETVLTIAGILAVISMFILPIDAKYADYIDINTLLLLFALMSVVAGFSYLGMFDKIGAALLKKIHNSRQMLFVLIFLPFVFSMIITNDVALITFVPFGIIILKMAGCEELVIKTVVLQTIAANLGSMLTPIGNPQNLYLYGKSGMGTVDFVLLMLPYTLVSALGIIVLIMLIKKTDIENVKIEKNHQEFDMWLFAGCVIGFILSIMSVAKVFKAYYPAIYMGVFLLIRNRKLLKKVDYSLLITFIFFFVFIGNMGRIEWFKNFLESIIAGREAIVAIMSSQVISNVPSALLLSGFTADYRALVIGTNIGGLGTLIASMASLISYRQIVSSYNDLRGKYLIRFTVVNLIMLVVLVGFFFLYN